MAKNIVEAIQEETPVIKTVSGTDKHSDNQVMIIGKIVNVFPTDKTLIVTVRVPKREPKGRVSFAFPKVYFFKADDTGIETFKEGDSIQITGHLVNPVKRRANGTRYFSQAIIGDKAVKNTSLFSTMLGTEDIGFANTQPASLVYLRGRVEQIMQVGNRSILIRLNAKQNGRNNHINVTTTNKDALLCTLGDIITIYGTIETRVAEKEDKKRYYQNIIAQKLVNESREIK